MGLCTETLALVSPPIHISNLGYGHTPPLEVCARGRADFNRQFFFMRRYVSEIDFRKLPELRGHVPHASWPRPRRTQRVARARRARWGGARGPLRARQYRATARGRWLRLTLWAATCSINQTRGNCSNCAIVAAEVRDLCLCDLNVA